MELCPGAGPQAASGAPTMYSFSTVGSFPLRVARRIQSAWVTRSRTVLGWRASPARDTGWSATVEQVIEDLETLNRSTERDFLAVGGKLMEFLRVARRISSDMAALTELFSGEQGRDASAALNRVLEHARAMGARIERSVQALARVRELGRRIQFAFLRLEETVAVFRALCTLTRIETAQLGSSGAGFHDLAEEVRPLSESIQSSGQTVLETSEHLTRSVEAALRKGTRLSQRQLAELHALISSVVESLQSFEERQRRAEEASVRQAAEHAAMCEAIEDLVRSIQFHDITRQQIEHVIQALREIRLEASSGAQAVLTLQSSQLASAGDLFGASIARMERDLESIAERVRNMAEASRSLLGLSEEEQDSFFLRMEACFTGILKAVGECTEAESVLEATGAELEETIGKMQESVEGIRGIEIHIQRIALNATIRSAQIGAAGSALNVIADVMHRAASDSNANTEEAAAALDSMREAAQSSTKSSGPQNASDLPVQMRRAILGLHSSSERSFSRVHQIAALSSRLEEEVRSVSDGLAVGAQFAETVAGTRRELERIGARAARATSEAADDAADPDIERFQRHYTMQSEREVHKAVAEGAPPAQPLAADGPLVPTGGGDLGDNVELF
jgi:hypothetical protein